MQLRTLLTASTWRRLARSARARPRLAVAVLGLLAVLMLGAMTVGEFGDHGDEGPRLGHSHQF